MNKSLDSSSVIAFKPFTFYCSSILIFYVTNLISLCVSFGSNKHTYVHFVILPTFLHKR